MSTTFVRLVSRSLLTVAPFAAFAGCSSGLSGQAGSPAAGEARAAASPYAITERAETGPVTALAFRAPVLYAGTAHGLRRWDVTNDEYEPLGADAGLLGR